MLSVNEKAMEIAEEMMDWSDELKIKVFELKNGGKIIDCGINVEGDMKQAFYLLISAWEDLAQVQYPYTR